MQSGKATQIQLDITSDLQKWRAFLAIAALGSLTRAALFLDSNQSLLSRHLNALERECNARLFNRTGRGVALSDVGQRIFPLVKALLSDAEQLEMEIHGEAREPSGRVTIGSLPSITNPIVGRLFKQLRERHPGIQLKILEGSSGQVEEWLSDARVDIAILYRYGSALHEQEQALATVDSYLIGAAGDRLTAKPELPFFVAARAALHPAGRAERPAHRARRHGPAGAHHAGTGAGGRFAAAHAIDGCRGPALHGASHSRRVDGGAGGSTASRQDRLAGAAADRLHGLGAHEGTGPGRVGGRGGNRRHRGGQRAQRHVALRRPSWMQPVARGATPAAAHCTTAHSSVAPGAGARTVLVP